MEINNTAELEKIILGLLNEALTEIMGIFQEKLKEFIVEDVYSYQSGGGWHDRTYEFGNSWVVSPLSISGLGLSATLSNDTFQFSWNEGTWSHGNKWEKLDNDSFDEIINNRQGGSNFGFPALQRPYWTHFIEWVTLNFDNVCSKVLAKYDITPSGTMSWSVG